MSAASTVRCATLAAVSGLRSLSLSALLVLSASGASADVIPEDYVAPVCPSVSCLPGSLPGGGGHGSCPSLCVPWSQTCTSDAECGGPGWSCVPTRFCLERMPTGRMIQDVVVGECGEGDTCTTGTCSAASRCMPTPTPPGGAVPTVAAPSTTTTTTAPPSDEGSSMCAAGRGRAGWAAPLATVLAFVLAIRRRGR